MSHQLRAYLLRYQHDHCKVGNTACSIDPAFLYEMSSFYLFSYLLIFCKIIYLLHTRLF